jgi:hypothetical protein
MSNLSLTVVKNALTKGFGRGALILQKRSPEILLVTGVVGVVASGVLACRATLKYEQLTKQHREKLEHAKKAREAYDEEDYTPQEYKRDITVIYAQTATSFLKLYGPSVTLGAFSLASIICSYGIMKKRSVALIAAYKALEEGFNAYRQRVREEFGEDTDYAFRHGLRAEKVLEEDENGKMVEKTKFVKKDDSNQPSMYARWFDEGNQNWSKEWGYNRLFLKAQQNYANDLLKTRGHLFLNDVYDILGFERTTPGALVGWVLGNGGNDYVDFGIFDGDNPRARAFINGDERNVLLDFNVDGLIYDKIEKKSLRQPIYQDVRKFES